MKLTTKIIYILLMVSDVSIPPNSPNRALTLCPSTGKRLMKAEGEKTPDPTPPSSPKSMMTIDDSIMNKPNDNSTIPTLIKVCNFIYCLLIVITYILYIVIVKLFLFFSWNLEVPI